MQIETERLVLRPLGPADLPTVHRYASDPENARYMFFGLKQTEADTAAFLAGVEAEWKKEAPSFYEFALTLDGVQFGAVGLYLNDSRTEGELGWILDRRYQGKGYALEGAKAVVDFAFREIGPPYPYRPLRHPQRPLFPADGAPGHETGCRRPPPLPPDGRGGGGVYLPALPAKLIRISAASANPRPPSFSVI